jgi:hypothetical protein
MIVEDECVNDDRSFPVCGHNREGSLANTTDTSVRSISLVVSLTEENVTALTPFSAPRVSDDPVRSRCGIVVTLKSNSVVKSSTTS